VTLQQELSDSNLLWILYMNIDLRLWNKSHGPMNYKIGVTCVFNGQ